MEHSLPLSLSLSLSHSRLSSVCPLSYFSLSLSLSSHFLLLSSLISLLHVLLILTARNSLAQSCTFTLICLFYLLSFSLQFGLFVFTYVRECIKACRPYLLFCFHIHTLSFDFLSLSLSHSLDPALSVLSVHDALLSFSFASFVQICPPLPRLAHSPTSLFFMLASVFLSFFCLSFLLVSYPSHFSFSKMPISQARCFLKLPKDRATNHRVDIRRCC